MMPVSGMGMPDPIPTFTELVTCIRDTYPDFAYIHIIEGTDIGLTSGETTTRPSTKFLRDIWGDRPYISNGCYERDTAIEEVEKEGGLVSFGRHFISNVGVDHPCPVEVRTDWSVLTARSPTPLKREHRARTRQSKDMVDPRCGGIYRLPLRHGGKTKSLKRCH